MERNYSSGVASNIDFFVGIEIEKTPAYGLKTLFVSGIHRYTEIEEQLANRDITHIFFGANHSCKFFNDIGNLRRHEDMIEHFLKNGYYCSLDILLEDCLIFKESILCNYDRFIPQIRVPIPFISTLNKNAMLKIDDIGFNQTNLGIWTHKLSDLLLESVFTNWSAYQNDEILK